MPAKKKPREKVKNCFVISPIGKEGTETRRRSDLVFKHIISPAVTECGYKPTRADKISETGIITTHLIQRIAEDPMVVADLTERNANVFYELALRHALQLPVIQIIDKREKPPFDVAATRIVLFDHTDLDSVEEAKKEIVRQVKASEKPNFKMATPISIAVELQSLLKSKTPEDKHLGDFLSSLQEIQNSVLKCERKLSRPDEILPPRYVEAILRHSPSSIPSGLIRELGMLLEALENTMDSAATTKSSRELRRSLERIRYKLMSIRDYLHIRERP